MAMEIRFPGGKKVDAHFKGFTIKTDQGEKDGGEGSAPTPSFLFLASLGTCAGLYALNFCEKRKIETAKLKLELEFKTHKKTHMVEKVRLNISRRSLKRWIFAMSKSTSMNHPSLRRLHKAQFNR